MGEEEGKQVFTAKNKKYPPYVPLKVNNNIIDFSDVEKYLGLLLDDKLSWKPHINCLRTQLISLCGPLRKIGNCLLSTAQLRFGDQLQRLPLKTYN